MRKILKISVGLCLFLVFIKYPAIGSESQKEENGLTNERLADEIYLGDIIMPEDFGISQEIIGVVKKYLSSLCRRDAKKALSYLSEEAKRKFEREGIIKIIGTSNPHYCAFKIKNAEKISEGEVVIKYRLYSVYTGYVGIEAAKEDYLTIRKIKNEWVIDAV